MKLPVFNLKNENCGEIELQDTIFGLEPNPDILARVVQWQLAKRRSGCHKVKQRSEVIGSTKKIYKQKGTGSARHGSKKPPQFRGGGVAHGPVVRSHAYSLPKKVRKLGLKVALSSKLQSQRLFVIDGVDSIGHKTKDLAQLLEKWGYRSILFINSTDENQNFVKAVSNLPNMNVLPPIGTNVYDILKHDCVMLVSSAAKGLEGRLQ